MIKLISAVFNRPEYTKIFLDSLYSVDHGEQIWPIIVSNGSRKKTQMLLQEWQNKYTSEMKEKILKPEIIMCSENKGFAGAINEALSCTNPLMLEPGKICIMHNDTVPFTGWAKEMLECFNYDEDMIIVVPRTNYANETGVCLTDLRVKFQQFKLNNKEKPDESEIMSILEKTYSESKEVFLKTISETNPRFSYLLEISSFCMMFDPILIQKYGKFDEDFFPRMYEDKMWFRPMQRDGVPCYVANRAFVHHWGNITSDGPGMCFPDMAKANEEKYKKKCAEIDAKFFKIEKPMDAAQVTATKPAEEPSKA